MRWSHRGLPQELIRRLRELLRPHQGRAAEPTACIVDSQIVKAHDTVPRATSGYHGGKKITGRGRRLAVDAEGWLLALVVTAACGPRQGRRETPDHPAVRRVQHAEDHVGRLRLRRRPAGPLCQGRRRDHRRGRQAHQPAFLPGAAPPVGHGADLGWLMRYRRLARDYERRPRTPRP